MSCAFNDNQYVYTCRLCGYCQQRVSKIVKFSPPAAWAGIAAPAGFCKERASRTLRCQQLELFGCGFWYAGNPSNVKSPVQASTTGCVRTQGGVSGGMLQRSSKCFNTFSAQTGRQFFQASRLARHFPCHR